MIEKKSLISDSATPERAILVGLVTPRQDEAKATEYLSELAFLADTAGAEAVKTVTQRLDYPN
ncbi:MAG: GTPase HflX, partial [Muribaculaceae bacterium]|nr:GTPase HflX [Muribaculaceae bacterium]